MEKWFLKNSQKSHGMPKKILDFFVWKNVQTKKHIFNS